MERGSAQTCRRNVARRRFPTLPNDEALVFLRGHNALRLKKLDYNPAAKQLWPTTAAAYTPSWLADDLPMEQDDYFYKRKPREPEQEPERILRRRRDTKKY